jgi:hypothetical protein
LITNFTLHLSRLYRQSALINAIIHRKSLPPDLLELVDQTRRLLALEDFTEEADQP